MNHPESAALASAPTLRKPRTARVFFALWPDADARVALAALAREIAARTKGRAPPAANLHMTLAFIGEVPPERIGALSDERVEQILAGMRFQQASFFNRE